MDKPQNESPRTELGAFLAKRGTLVVKQFRKVGSLNGLYQTSADFDAISIYSPGTFESRLNGVRITLTSRAEYERQEDVFLDIDEIDSLSSAMVYTKQVADEWQGQSREYTEVLFTTKDNFRIGFFQVEKKQQAFARCGFGQGVSLYLIETSDLLAIRAICDNAKKYFASLT